MKVPTATIIRLYDEGLAPAKIGKRYGLTKYAVLSRLIRAGHPMRPRGSPPGLMKRPQIKTVAIVKAWKAGLNYSQIAARFHITRPAVVYRLKLAGCELPNRRTRLQPPEN